MAALWLNGLEELRCDERRSCTPGDRSEPVWSFAPAMSPQAKRSARGGEPKSPLVGGGGSEDVFRERTPRGSFGRERFPRRLGG